MFDPFHMLPERELNVGKLTASIILIYVRERSHLHIYKGVESLKCLLCINVNNYYGKVIF